MIAFAWVYIKSIEFDSKSRTASYFLPNKIISLINEGKDLGDAVDMISEKNNSKQKNGFIGILTGDLITRTSLYESAIIMALIPFKNEDLYLN